MAIDKLTELAIRELKRKHVWLQKQMIGVVDGTVVEYNDGDYYSYILPDYLFEGVDDTVKLEEWLNKRTDFGRRKFNHILELACGGGRATGIISRYANNVTAVDISPSQLDYARRNVSGTQNVRFVQRDMLDFIDESSTNGTLNNYDLIFSFWGFFYGTNDEFLKVENDSLVPVELTRAYDVARRNLLKLFTNIDSAAQFLFFHVRSDTEEQRVYRPVIGSYCDVFMPPKKTPSEILLPQVLAETGHDFNWTNVEGSVDYPSMEKALETNINFHLKGFFNDKPELPLVYQIIRGNLERFEKKGIISMQAGYIQIDKNES